MTTKTATPAKTATDAPVFTFSEAPVPATTRASSAVNPMLDACTKIKASMKDGRSTIALSTRVGDDAQVGKVKRWLALAGKELGVTFRSIVKDTTVTFWAVERITHKS